MQVIEKATQVNKSELAAVTKEGMPNIPDLDMFKYYLFGTQRLL